MKVKQEGDDLHDRTLSLLGRIRVLALIEHSICRPPAKKKT
jgi:hypothetical protein